MADIYTYLSSKSIGSLNGLSLCFNSSGTRAYFVSTEVVPNRVRELSLSVPWDISTAVFTGDTLSPTTYLYSCFIAPNDSALYICQSQSYGVFNVYQYSLAGGLSTASYVGVKNFTDAAGTGSYWIHSGMFEPTGQQLILAVNTTGGGLYLTKYNLSSPFNISSAIKVDAEYFFTGAFTPQIFASPTGKRIYTVDAVPGVLSRFDLSTPWDFSTLTTTDSFATGIDHITGVFASEEVEKLFLLVGTSPGSIREYSFTPVPVEFWTNFSGQTEILV